MIARILSVLLASGAALALGTARTTIGDAPAADAALAPTAVAQRQQYPSTPEPNAPYDGRYTFVRLRFTPRGGGGFFGRVDLKWNHDYPDAERNFAQIVAELSTIRPYMKGGNIFTVDDPELMKYPIAYMCEPGFWNPTDGEATALRAYLLKGGFMIFDDFYGRHWVNFEAQMRRVLPQGRLVRLDATHPIFDAFFHVDQPDHGFGSNRRAPPEFWGIFEDNDPQKRLLAIVNFNNDIGESWEFSDTGVFPVDVSNEAYKLGINYLVYGMTH